MDLPSNETVALDRYFERIGFAGSVNTDAGTLRALHLAHTTRIPFENLDVLLGRPIHIDLESVERKLVADRRGGYCFEQNALFAAVLEQIGFKVTRLLARVRLGTSRPLPRTHMILMVEAGGYSWIADVGFGGWGLLEPLPLLENQKIQQGAWTFHLLRENGLWVLQCPQCTMGIDQYAFTLEPCLPVDYEPVNYYSSTFPGSRFVQTLTVQLPSLTKRVILKNRELITVTADSMKIEIVEDEDALFNVLRGYFGLSFPPGTSFEGKYTAG